MRPLSLPGKEKPYLMAHRGNRVRCPENTLAAFRQALLDGADLLETDLHLTADNVFVCIHDATLDRTTDAEGPVKDRTLVELKKISASYGRPEFADERIPTLAELAAILPPDVGLALELKIDDFLQPETGRKLSQELKDLGIDNRSVIISFSLERLQAVQAVDPHLPAGWITMTGLRPIEGVQLLGPFWPLLLLNPGYIRKARERGQIACPLDSHGEKRVRWYRRLGCDVIMSDDPAALAKSLGR
ncbi:MAG: glycerophosphodiester phosphodiesterase family protein [Anaerolineaceae bacterium]|nr:glycerophosphodiester phosphodiesterase family protein [Anaerolineaceae bacterium]